MLRTFKEGSLFCVATRLLAEWPGVRILLGATITLSLKRPGRGVYDLLTLIGGEVRME